jgi:hypothetical protein
MRKSSRTSTKLLQSHILSGINELVKPWRDHLRNDFENIPLKEMLCLIKGNFTPGRPLENLSKKNWRLIEQLILSEGSTSKEKILEKRIAALLKPHWVNQVPTASGYCGSGGRKRSIDLVCRSDDSTFIFYELKVLPESGDPFDATIELLGYGLLYIYSRSNLAAYKDYSLMKAATVHLRVLGTWDYYQQTRPSKRFQDAISLDLGQFAFACLPKCEMDFGFDTFPQGFIPKDYVSLVADSEDDRRVLAAVEGIHPWFG